MTVNRGTKLTAESELELISEKFLPVFKRHDIQKAIVFGSFARGEATRRSDLDLILIQETDKRFLDRYDDILYELGSKVRNRAVEVFIYTPLELEAMADRRFIATALREGKVIYEFKQESP